MAIKAVRRTYRCGQRFFASDSDFSRLTVIMFADKAPFPEFFWHFRFEKQSAVWKFSRNGALPADEKKHRPMKKSTARWKKAPPDEKKRFSTYRRQLKKSTARWKKHFPKISPSDEKNHCPTCKIGRRSRISPRTAIFRFYTATFRVWQRSFLLIKHFFLDFSDYIAIVRVWQL